MVKPVHNIMHRQHAMRFLLAAAADFGGWLLKILRAVWHRLRH
jgi:hypothetical protein